ncbi:MAG TPA: EamA family transporter, partial [Herpetosiphonaceae bacterium]
VAGAALGYAEGARLARTLGSWQVICWALVLASPLLLVPVGLSVAAYGASAPPLGWLCFAYVALISQFLAFFAWYRGLALGGVARVGQIQLLQPFLTLAASALLLGEHVTPVTIGFALLVLAVVLAGRKAAVRR